MMMTFKQQNFLSIASINVRGLNNNNKTSKIVQLIKDKNFDIICLQETYLTLPTQKFLQLRWNRQAYFSHLTHNSSGIAFLINNRKPLSNLHFTVIEPGRCACLSFSWNNTNLTLYNIYSPTSSSG